MKIKYPFFMSGICRETFNKKLMNNAEGHYSLKYKMYYHFFRYLLPENIKLIVHKVHARHINCNLNFIDDSIVKMIRKEKENEMKLKNLYPNGNMSAIVLTHDIESSKGMEFIPKMIELENKYGYKSSWNVVPYKYKIDWGIIKLIRENGCEIGIHGYNHDGKLFSSEKIFNERVPLINKALEQFGASGFRSPMVHHNLKWLQKLNIKYDSSCFDYDPYQPFPDSLCYIWPVTVGKFVELPYTLPQDHTLFCALGHKNIDLWKTKIKWLHSNNGIILILTHPDYMQIGNLLNHYEELLKYLQSVENSWHCLPGQLANWWTKLQVICEEDIIKNGDTLKPQIDNNLIKKTNINVNKDIVSGNKVNPGIN